MAAEMSQWNMFNHWDAIMRNKRPNEANYI